MIKCVARWILVAVAAAGCAGRGLKERTLEEVRRREPDYAIALRALTVDRALGANHPNPALRRYVLVTITRGLDCLHPLTPRRIVTIGYSERRVRGTSSLLAPRQPLDGESEAFVRSIRLSPLH